MRAHIQLYRAPLILSAICLIAVGSLTLVHQKTREKIAYVRKQYQHTAFGTLLLRSTKVPGQAPTAQVPKAFKVITNGAIAGGESVKGSKFVQSRYYIPKTKPNFELIHPLEEAIPELYILRLVGRGWGGPLELFAAYRPDGSLYHAIMLDNNETPGFGKRAEDPSYMKIFWDTGSQRGEEERRIPTSKQELEGTQLDAVSGSTISFRAISTALRAGADWLAEQ